jgi:hypothetical protein
MPSVFRDRAPGAARHSMREDRAMNDPQEKHEIWGTFSVKDHTRPGAFIADVIMYDQLVIPVPPSRWGNDKEEANAEWERWDKNGWDPPKQAQLLGILDNLAVPVEWNKKWRERWEKVATDRAEGTKQTAQALLGATGEALLQIVPAKARGAVAVMPYDSLDALKQDLGISNVRLTGNDLERGAHLPGHALMAIVGREFLVPEDPDKDEFELLRDAVRVARDPGYREARGHLHRSLNRFLHSSGETDAASIETAVKEMERGIDEMRRSEIWKKVRNGMRHSLFVGNTAMKAAAAPIGPAMAASAAISVGNYVAKEVLSSRDGRWDPRPYGALFVDAQQRLGLNAAGERATGVWERMLGRLAAR